ncbi:seminal metalloprotease 1-like [Musca vetustissima]|uniref:seminal metalloprotease 1-like n=1 Tax=Musca vetustissima TaxID=27455 RepID=UPI002AB66F59|nr:seminal metalloprotease 1-like [Musca vetustissima]
MNLLGSVIICTVLWGFVLALPLISLEETDPELTAGFVEGDMILDTVSRNGLRAEVYRWPNNTVYYKFFTEFDQEHRDHILRGMKMIEDVSCIRFEEATKNTKRFVNITGNAGGCSSTVGYRSKGSQSYNLQLYPLDKGCFRLGTIIHEFLHVLGFYHMQSTANRDEYVFINETNVKDGKLHNFKKYDAETVDDFDQGYDYASVLHYSAFAFSANGEMTIVPLKDADAAAVMGQRVGMSQSDINRLNLMYRCPVKV